MADGPKLATAYYELIAAAPGAEKQITDIVLPPAKKAGEEAGAAAGDAIGAGGAAGGAGPAGATEAIKLLVGFGEPLIGRALKTDAATQRDGRPRGGAGGGCGPPANR